MHFGCYVPKVRSSKRKDVFFKISTRKKKGQGKKSKSKPKQDTSVAEQREYILSEWFKNPYFLIDGTRYTFKNIFFEQVGYGKYILEASCEDVNWKLSRDQNGNVQVQAFSNDKLISIKQGTLTAKIFVSFLKLTYGISFYRFLFVGLKILSNKSEGQIRPKAATKEELLLWLTNPSLSKRCFAWLGNPSLKDELLCWFDNPFLIINNEKYVFQDIVIRQLDRNYVLVMTCCDIKWAFRQNEKGLVSVCGFYRKKPVEIKKKTPISKINRFFTILTKDLTFENFLAAVSNRFSCEQATRLNLYLFDPNTISQMVTTT